MSLSEIQSRVAGSLASASRPADAVTLIAVSKVQPLDRVRSVLDAGHRIFGENRVQEAAGKWPDLRAEFGAVELHLLGPLQTNKVNAALEIFDAIHSLDRQKLARKIADAVQTRGASPSLFVQVNTGREPQKAGIDPDALDGFVEECRGPLGLEIAGLMVIPPIDEDPAPHFRTLRDMAARNGLSGLSMGMSDDFETAIACGATHIRVGSAIFGARAAT